MVSIFWFQSNQFSETDRDGIGSWSLLAVICFFWPFSPVVNAGTYACMKIKLKNFKAHNSGTPI